MARMNRVPLVTVFLTCAFVAIVACAGLALCQTVPLSAAEQRLLSSGRPVVEQEIKLGNDYLSGHGVNKDEKQAAYWYEKAAEAGNPWAQKQIGFFYEAGIGVRADPVRAVHWYQLAAAAGLPDAKTNLGVAYRWGSGVRKDVPLAAQLFREAAGKGDGAAATYLGNMYFFGEGFAQDKAAAERWYKVGARLHNPVADFDMAMLLSEDGNPHDLARAAGWLRKSVAGGYVPAMHSLALLLQSHPELARSDRETLTLFRKASGYGQWKSSAALGIIYGEGKLTARDPVTAYFYLRLAILQGAQDPKQNLRQILEHLSSEIGAEPTARQDAAAQAWYSQHRDPVEFLLKDSFGSAHAGLALAAPASGSHAGQIIAAPPA